MGLETVVRPVVFPNIRPAPAQRQRPASDPEKDRCEIHGSSGQTIDLTSGWTINSSSSRPQEIKRRYDVARVYQQNDDGSVNRNNFIDIEVANRIWMRGSPIVPYSYARVEEADNIEIRERDKIKVKSV